MPEFLKDHPLAAPVLALGGLLAVFGTINDAYSLVEAELPNSVWQAIGLTAFFVSTAAIVLKQHRLIQRTIPAAHTGGGPDPQQVETTPSSVPWNDEAHLMLVFDKAMKNAKAVAQENVPYYYWYTIHDIQVEVGKDTHFRATPCGAIVFLSFQDPTHTSYNRVYVGDGIQCKVLGQNPYGATVWVAGDLRGRALDIRFSKKPILTG